MLKNIAVKCEMSQHFLKLKRSNNIKFKVK